MGCARPKRPTIRGSWRRSSRGGRIPEVRPQPVNCPCWCCGCSCSISPVRASWPSGVVKCWDSIHFVGVDPARRRGGLARRLYAEFFDTASSAGRSRVRCITSPANTGSIAFHRRMGFELVPGDTEIDGIGGAPGLRRARARPGLLRPGSLARFR
ncbi:GNAT family N-acetyltransferase [Saccharopolyspora sp. ASAGF58]|uniref:GNAT family N-acetyltransferase n=1 Tax=Saccharopolyspora sp. ASAGF58 TaxID=2719023 RepID=UPI00353008E5